MRCLHDIWVKTLDLGENFFFDLVDLLFELVQESEPMLVLANQILTRVHEYQDLGLFEITKNLVYNHEVIEVDLRFMDVGIYVPLVYHSLVGLRNYCDQVVEKDDYHEHGLENPNWPDEKHYEVFLEVGYLAFFFFGDPALVHRLMKVSNRISKAQYEIPQILI